jgi:peptidoglycan/LPS O-acetylase OafA/YrhL
MPGAAAARQRLAFLDVARGVAALLVLLEHGLGISLPGYTQWSLAHFNLGKIGVVVFLVVSGFIIPVSLEQGGSNLRFWLRRFWRLFPLYWLSIVLAWVYCRLGGRLLVGVPLEDTGNWLLNLTMLQGFLHRPHVWGVFWTLQLELVIYGVCSLLYSARILSRAGWIAGLALGGYAAIGLARPLMEGKPFGVGGNRFLYFAPLVGLVAQRYTAGQHGGRRLLAFLAGKALILLGVWSINTVLFPEEVTSACLWELVYDWGPAYVCFFGLVAMRHWNMPGVGCWLGRISYSLYLLHPLALALLAPTAWPIWAFMPTLLGSSLLLATLTFRLVEVPGIALGRMLEWRSPLTPTPLPDGERGRGEGAPKQEPSVIAQRAA